MGNTCKTYPSLYKKITQVRNEDGTEIIGDAISKESFYSLVRLYNAAMLNAHHSEYALRDETEYTDEQLLKIAESLDKFRSRGRSLARAREIYMKQMSEEYGSVYNMAAKMLSDNLTGKQINELQSGLLGAFYDVIKSERGNTSAAEFLETVDNDKFFEMLLKTKKQLLNDITEWIDTLEEDNEDTSAIRELTGKLFGVSYNSINNVHDIDGYFESIVDYELIMMTPIFSRILGRRINENLVIDNQENLDAIDDIDLDDTKNTDLESWQKDKDMDSATSNMSSYIYMALSLVPETESVSKAKYFLDGKEISAEEYDRLAEDSKSDDNNVSDKAKMLLKSVTVSFETEVNDKISSLTGYTMMSNPQVVARRLSTLLIDCHSYNDMKEVLLKQGYLYEDLVNRLETDYMFRNTFVSFFNKYQLDVVLTDSDRKGDGTITYHSKPVNKRTKKETLDSFLNRLRFKKGTANSIFNIVKAEGRNKNNLSLNPKKRISAERKYFGTVSRDSEKGKVYGDVHSIYYGLDYYAQNGEFDANSPANDYDHLKGVIRFVFETFGIEIEEDTLTSIASDKNNVAIFNDTAKNLFESKIFSELHNIDVNVIKGDKTVSENYYKLLMMANASRYSSYSTNMFTYAGNKQSSRILPSAITSFFKRLKMTRGEKIKALLDDKFLKSAMFADENGNPYNQILRDILESAEFNVLSKSFKDIIGITRNMGIDNVLAEDTDRRQHLLMDITTYFQNRKFKDDDYVEDEGTPFLKRKDGIVSQYRKYRDDYAYVPAFITGDNNTSRYYRLLHHTKKEIINGIYRLYQSELITIKTQDQFDKEGIAFYANDKESYFSSRKQRFGILSFLNEYIRQTDAATRDKVLNGGISKEEFEEIVKDHLNDGFKEFMTLLDREGITSRIYRGEKDNVGKYRNLEWLIDDDISKTDADERKKALEARLKDYYLNYKFGMYNIMNLTQVSTLFFRGVEDLQKRNKATLTNGYQVMVDAVDMKGDKIFKNGDAQRVVYFNDVNIAPSQADMDAIRNTAYNEYKRRGLSDKEAASKAAEFVEDYKTSTITDGEAYRSFESYRNILMSIGEPFWSVSKEKAYQRIMEIIGDNGSYENGDKNNNLTFDAFSEINRLMLTMQPIKPINDGIEDYADGAIKIPFQLKYAEVPILPEMYPAGSKLRQMGLWMRENGVDLMPSTKCGKKGVFGAADLQYMTVGGSYVDADLNCLKGMKSDGVTEIDGDEEPTMDEQKRYIAKTGKDDRVSYDDSVSFDEIMANCQSIEADASTGKMHGYVIHTLPVSTMLIQSNNPDHISAMSTLSSQARKIITKAIKSDVVYTVDGKKIDGKRLARLYNYFQSMKYARSAKSFLKDITNDDRMRRKFTRLVLSSDRMNPALVERLANGISMSELSSAKDLESLLVSEYKKSVVKQMIEGGMAIQAASLGVGSSWVADQELNAIIKDGVVVGVECEIAFDFFYKNVSGKDARLDYDTYCNQDGTFKMTEDGKQTLIEHDFPGILDIVGTRIPTEKEYSMFAMHIKRVTPKGCANSLKLPSWCTTRADFDFDIDKLYLMRHNYVSRMEFSNEDVWKDVYKGEKGLQGALERARDSVSEDEKAELAKKLGHNPFLHDYWDYLPLNFAMESKEAIFERYAEKRNQRKYAKPSFIDITVGLDKLTANDDIDKAINNALVDIYLGVLSDPSTSFDSMSHGGFDGASEAARFSRVLQNLDALKSTDAISDGDYKALFDDKGNIKIENLITLLELDKDLDFKPEYDYSEPETSMLFKEKNQAGDNLIGIFANGDMNAFISTKLKKLRFNSASRILFGSLAENVSEVNGSIDEADIAKADIGCNLLNTTVNGVESLKNLAELLGASVDAVKNPVLEYLNLNTDTADVAGMLFRLGYSMTDVALLLNQPVVRKACEYMRYNNVRSVSTALKRVLTDNYGFTRDEVKSMFDNDKSGYDYKVLTQDNLAKAIFKGDAIFRSDVAKNSDLLDEIKNITRNVAVLFNMATSNAINLGSYVRKVRNTSSNTLKSRFADFISQKMKSENSSFGNLEIETSDTMADPIGENWKEWSADTFNRSINEFLMENSDHPFGYENVLYNINRFFMDYMMKKYTPYASGVYAGTVDNIGRLTSKNGLNGDTIETLHRFIPMFRMAHSNGVFNPGKNSPYNRVNEDGTAGKPMYNDEFYINSSNNNSFMGNIARLVKGEPNLYARTDEEITDLLNFLSENEFFDNINSGYISDNSNIEALTFRHSFYISPSEKMALKYSFMELYERYPKLARDVFMHFYYAYGINPVYNQVMELAPVELLKNLIVDKDSNTSYFDMFKGDDAYNKSDGLYGFNNMRGLWYAFIISQKDNPDVVPVVYRGNKTGDTLTISGYGVRDLILKRYKNDKGKFTQTYSVKPVIKYKGDLYALRNGTGLFGYDSITNEVTGDSDGSLNEIVYEKAVILNDKGTDIFVTSKNWYVYSSDRVDNVGDTESGINGDGKTAPEVTVDNGTVPTNDDSSTKERIGLFEKIPHMDENGKLICNNNIE